MRPSVHLSTPIPQVSPENGDGGVLQGEGEEEEGVCGGAAEREGGVGE